MRLAIGIIVLAAALGAVKLWTTGATSGWVSTEVMVGAGLGVIVVAWVVGVWLRNRQRRRLIDMRDSALW
jgi:Tfp pilus assembly protein PilW